MAKEITLSEEQIKNIQGLNLSPGKVIPVARMNLLLYPVAYDMILAIKKHLPPDFYGVLQFRFEFRNGQIYKVENIEKRESLNVDKLR